MPQTDSTRRTEPWRRRLRLPAYTVADAARYADVHSNTVRYWFYGRPEGAGRHRDRPTLKEKARGASLTYLQLIEIAVVAAIRGRWKAGEEVPDIREDFALEERDVVDALNFEGIEIPAA